MDKHAQMIVVVKSHMPVEDWHCSCGEDCFGGTAAYSLELYASHLASLLLELD